VQSEATGTLSIYADNSATTQTRPEVTEAITLSCQENWGNASSIHAVGRKAKQALENARSHVARLLNCENDEVWFSASGTNSNNIALLGRARFAEANELGKHLIISDIEHPSVLGPAQYLESHGWRVTYIPVNREGFIDLDKLKTAISKDTSIISIVWGNNEIGTIQPIAEIAKIAKEHDIFFHTDAVQVAGKFPIDLKALPVSALSLSGHKFHAPKGIGVLFLRAGANVMPITFGGGQERGFFPGTESVTNIIGLGKAAELAFTELQETETALRKMQSNFMTEISQLKDIKLTGPADINKRLPGHASFVAAGMEGEAMVMRLNLNGIYASSGSACHNGLLEPSHVLRALGMSNEEAKGSVRITFGKFNTIEEVGMVTKTLKKILEYSP